MLKTGDLKDYTILVTGACGFIGSPLIRALLCKGATVFGIDCCTAFPRQKRENIPFNNFGFISGDFISRHDEIASMLSENEKGNSALIHLAGNANASDCKSRPFDAFMANILLVEHALEFCRKNNISKFIFPSTGLVYGDQSSSIVHENSPLRPLNLYAATKLSAEMLIQGYATEFGINCIVTRLSNVYGPSSRSNTVLGAIIEQSKKKKKIYVEDISPIRDFIHIDDVVIGLIRLLNCGDSLGYTVVNLSTGHGETIRMAVELVSKITKIEIDNRVGMNNKRKPTSKLVMDNSLLDSITGWKPEISLYSGLSSILKGSD